MNFFEGIISGVYENGYTVNIPDLGQVSLSKKGSLPLGARVIYCMRPERQRISLMGPAAYENGLTGIIRRKDYLGEITKFTIELSNGKMITVVAQNYLLQLSNEFFDIGEQIFVTWSKTSGEVIHAR
jgi:hypothetical protein